MQSKTKAENWLTNDTEKEELAIVGFDRKSQPWSNTIYIIHLRRKKIYIKYNRMANAYIAL